MQSMNRKVIEEALVDAEGIADMLGVSRSAVNAWAGDPARFDFPEPVFQRLGKSRSATRIWLRHEVYEWSKSLRRSRGRPKKSPALDSGRQ